MEKKIVNTKFTLHHINAIKAQAKMNKRNFHDELELILDDYFIRLAKWNDAEKELNKRYSPEDM
jgi:hypothetical protein